MEGLDLNAFWKHRRVLVTGATGFLGSWLVKELLELGASPVALVRDMDPQSELLRSGAINRVTVVNGELENFRTMERVVSEQETDTVFHLGAQTLVTTAKRTPLLTMEANVRGTYNLLDACRLHRDIVKRIVIASSDKVYGDQQAVCRETTPMRGDHPYEASKCCAELIARSYVKAYGLPLTIARCGNLYGGGDLHWDRLIPGTIRALLEGERPIIRSDGHYIREYLYIRDATAAYLALAARLDQPGIAGEAFNFSPERPYEVLEVVDAIKRLMDCAMIEPVILNKAAGEIVTQSLSSEKAQRLLQWRARWTLEDGLGETIAWYRALLKPERATKSRARLKTT